MSTTSHADPSHATAAASETPPEPGLLALLLRPFAKVEPGEAVSALVLMVTVFLLLMAYYFLKTAREPLILLHGGAEVKSYAAAGQSLLLLLVVPAYSALARRVGRMKLIAGIYGFFALNLLLFAGAAQVGTSLLGIAFYLWVGIFNVTAIAQFWSFANDVYTPEQGKRLFALLGIGSSVGAVAGSLIARKLAALGPQAMMLGAAAVLCVCIALFAFVDGRERGGRGAQAGAAAQKPVIDGPALALLLRDRYVLLIAALVFLLNCVNTNGEYVLDRTLLAAVSDGSHGDPSAFVGAFKAEYFGWVNVIGVVLQLFVVSRILTRLGVRAALFILPLVAFASYGMIVAVPLLALIRIGKIAENSLDYSVQNTARQALFLVGNRVEKYLGKTVIDTFVVRLGDVFSAALVLLASTLALPVAAFAALNLGFIACWLGVLVALGREHKRRSEALASSEPA
jgi:AAA family ATP:ADP antiporter